MAGAVALAQQTNLGHCIDLLSSNALCPLCCGISAYSEVLIGFQISVMPALERKTVKGTAGFIIIPSPVRGQSVATPREEEGSNLTLLLLRPQIL